MTITLDLWAFQSALYLAYGPVEGLFKDRVHCNLTFYQRELVELRESN